VTKTAAQAWSALRVLPENKVTSGYPSGVEGGAKTFSMESLFEMYYLREVERGGGVTLSLRAWLERAEAWRILQALRECRGNRSAAARQLGIGRRTLYSKMEKLGVASLWDRTVL